MKLVKVCLPSNGSIYQQILGQLPCKNGKGSVACQQPSQEAGWVLKRRAKRACPQDGSLRLSMLQSDRSHGVFVFDPVDFSDAKGQPHRNGSVGLWPV